MAKQKIEVGLLFSADTTKAKAALKTLESDLSKVQNLLAQSSTTKLANDMDRTTKTIQAAKDETFNLSLALRQAANTDTGKLDLTKFQKSLQASNTDLKKISNALIQLGPEGERAFYSLQDSIMKAEIPARKMNATLNKMLTSLAKTAGWQMSSGIVHGITGAIEKAYYYAEDLNKSLNDIRIVTGYSTEYMEDFAKEANKAARALSATTSEYTKASLIYFQQGLSEEDVKKRTETTLKMANVTGEAASDVSSYMTAIWNNFDDGSKKLDYYADAITALGAATASSSEEIATGLQKFAAVAQTVGLSYDYATAALATVTSATRESAETVGTAFKTIFARLESLSLGETLEDNTNLTKYSQALAAVGVSIKDSTGELKEMDQIVDEVGQKWKTIGKDQQIALAQTVAGMRQYNNFIALMENYDTFKGNVNIAANSEGTLNKQSEIYAESWEAARDRVQAAAEEIYEKLLDDDFFIDLLNFGEKALDLLSKFIDMAGGLKGIVSGLSAVLLQVFSSQVTQGIRDSVEYVRGFMADFTGWTKKATIDYKKMAAQTFESITARGGEFTPEQEARKKKYIEISALQIQLAENEDRLSEREKAQVHLGMELLELEHNRIIALAEQEDELEKQKQTLLEQARIKEKERVAEEKAKLNKATKEQEDISQGVLNYKKYTESWLTEAEGKDIRKSDIQEDVAFQIERLKEDYDTTSGPWKEILAQYEKILSGVDKVDKDQLSAEDLKNIIPDKDVFKDIREERAHAYSKETGMTWKDARQVITNLDSGTEGKNIDYLNNIRQNLDNSEALFEENQQQAIDTFHSEYSQTAEIEQSVKKAFSMYSNSRDMEKTKTAIVEAMKLVENNEPYDEPSPEAQAIIDGLAELLDRLKSEENYLGEDGKRKTKAERIELMAGEDATEEDKKQLRNELNKEEHRNKAETFAATENYTQIKRAEADEKLGKATSQEILETEKKLLEVREESSEKMEETQKMAEETSKVMNQTKKSDWADTFVNVAQSMTAAFSAASMLKSAWDTLQDPDVSAWEKIVTVFSTLAMVIPLASSAISNLGKVFGIDTIETIKNTGAKLLNWIARKKTAAAADASSKEISEETQDIQQNTQETNENSASKIANEAVEKSTQNNGGGTSGSGTGSGGTTGGGTGGTGTGGSSPKTTKGGKMPKITGAQLGGAALVAAGILLIVGAIALSIDLYNKEQKEAKRAAKQAAIAEENAAKAKQKYQETVDTITSFEDGTKKLKELTKGTTEWKEALADTNEEAKKLIEQFGEELQGKYHIEDGQIVFDEGALEALEEAQLEERNKASAAADMARINAIEKQNEAKKQQLAREKLSSLQDWDKGIQNTLASTAVGAAGGSLIGGGIGLMGGPWGTAAGFGVGALIGAGVGLTTGIGASIAAGASGSEEEILDQIAKEYKKDSTLFASKENFKDVLKTELNINDDMLIDSLWENREAVEKLTKEVNAANAEAALLRQSAILTANAGKAGMDEYVAAYVGREDNLYEEKIQREAEAHQEAQSLYWGQEGVNPFDSVFWQLPWERNDALSKKWIEESLGGKFEAEEAGGYRVVDDWGSGGQVQYWDEAEKKWKNYGDRYFNLVEKMEDDLAKASAMDLKDDEIKKIREKKNAQVNTLVRAGVGTEEAEQIATKWASEGTWDYSSLSRAALDRLKKDKSLDKDQREAIENANKSWEEALNNYLGSTQTLLNNQSGIWKNFSKAITTAYAGQLDQITKLGGDSSAFNAQMDALLKNYAGREEEILNILNSIDFSQGQEGLNAFIAELHDNGFVIPTETLGSMKEALDDMPIRVMNGELSELKETLKGINELVTNIHYGDIVSDEDYAKIVKFNAAAREMFMYTADGWKWTGNLSDKKTLRDNVDTYIEELSAQNTRKNELALELEKQEKSSGKDWSYLTEEKDQRVILEYLKNQYSDSDLGLLGISKQGIDEILGLSGDEFEEQASQIFGNINTAQANANSVEYQQRNYETMAAFYEDEEALYDAYKRGIFGVGDAAYEIYVNNWERIQKTKKEIKKSIDEFSLNTIDWELEQIEDRAGNMATKIAKIGEKSQYRESLLAVAKEELQELLDAYDVDSIDKLDYSKLTAEEVEYITNYQEAYQQYVDGVYEDNEAMLEQLGIYFSDITEEYNKSAKATEKLTSMTNHYRNTIGLLGKGLTNIGKDFEASIVATEAEAYRQQTETTKKTLDGLMAKRQQLQAEYDKLKASGEVNDKVIAQWEATFEEIDEQIDEVSSNLQDSMTSSLEAAADAFSLRLADALEDFEKGLTGKYESLSRLNEVFEQQSQLNAQYVSDYEKIYKLSKLTRQIENSMNNSNSVKSKTILAELQNEITAAQAAGKKLSEYDLEYMDKKYQLRLAEIALEESQNAKSQVRLARSAEGGWGYVYTQNTDNIEKAEQNYEDKLFALQDFNNQQMNTTASTIIAVQSEFTNAIRSIYEDSTLTDAERMARINEVTEYYSERLQFASDQYDTVIAHNAELYNQDWESYSLHTGYKISANEEFAHNFETSILGTLEAGFESADDIFKTFTDLIGNPSDSGEDSLLGSLNSAYNEYKNIVSSVMEDAGTPLNEYSTLIGTALWGEGGTETNPTGGLVDNVKTAAEQIKEYLTKIFDIEIDGENTLFDSIINTVNEWTNKVIVENTDLPAENGASDSSSGGSGSTDSEPKPEKQESPSGNTSSGTTGSVPDLNEPAPEKKVSPVVNTIKSWQLTGKHVSSSGVLNNGKSSGVAGTNLEGKWIEKEVEADWRAEHPDVKKGAWFEALYEPYFYDENGTKYGPTGDREIDNIHGVILDNIRYRVDGSDEDLVKIQYGGSYEGIKDSSLELWESSVTKLKGANIPVGTVLYTPVKFLNHWNSVDWFDTGGYTGNWGPEGRLAMLHQKEIVLNADDTKNLLSAVDLVRTIASTIDLQAKSQALVMNMRAALVPTQNQALEQQVTIHAEFPNATNHSEIEEAFDTLINRATQYTNRF